MNTFRCLRALFSSCISAAVAVAGAAGPSSANADDAAQLAALARADGRTLDANANLIPAPLDRAMTTQRLADGREIAVPIGMRLVPADAATGTASFFAGIYEVTQAEYSAFLVANPDVATPRAWASRECPAATANFPVTGISHADALAYCAWIEAGTGRAVTLPTAAQFAALARGSQRSRPENFLPLHAVGSDHHDISALGCYDTAGNAGEWLRDQSGSSADDRIGFRLVARAHESAIERKTDASLFDAVVTQANAPQSPPPVPWISEWIRITRQPISRGVSPGTSVDLEIEAVYHQGADEGPISDPSCQWLKDGVVIPGASKLKLTLQNVQEKDVGVYLCLVSMSAGTLTQTSEPAVIALGTTGTAPRITRSQPEVFVPSGGTALVSFDFAAAYPSAAVWEYSYAVVGDHPPTAPDIQVSQSETSATATWRNVPRDGQTTLIIRIFTAYGTAEASTKVTAVNDGAAPSISRQPSGATVTRGGSATLSVTASGTPAPSFQWSLNGNAIAGATSASLSLANIQDANTGAYSVTVSNVLGSVTSTTASISIAAPAPTPSGSGGGGGGAPGIGFIAAVAVLTLLRIVGDRRSRR